MHNLFSTYQHLPQLQDDEENVSHDVEQLLTSIHILKSIDYIAEQTHAHSKIKPIYSIIIFQKTTI